MEKYKFTNREEVLLMCAIVKEIVSCEDSFDYYSAHGGIETAEEKRKDIEVLTSLFNRFFPGSDLDKLLGEWCR